MTRTQKPYYDEQGHLIIRPYRMKDLAAIYCVSTKTMKRWIDTKAPAYSNKTKMFFTIEQVTGIFIALGVPQKIALVVPIEKLKQAV
jgi:hypothetical protein